MEEKSLAVAQPENSFTQMMEMAKVLLSSQFLPQAIKTPAQATAIILMGRELGIGPMQSLSKINIIQGKPTCSAELMLGLAYQKVKGFLFKVIESTDKQCVAEVYRDGKLAFTSKFTIEDAAKMGLVGKDNWKKQGATMLRWRCISAGLRVVCPDAIAGLYTPEELDPDVKIDFETGEVLSGTSPAPTPSPIRPIPLVKAEVPAPSVGAPAKAEEDDVGFPQPVIDEQVVTAAEVFNPTSIIQDQPDGSKKDITKEVKKEVAKRAQKKAIEKTAHKGRAPQMMPKIERDGDQLNVLNCYPLKDKLREMGFRWNPNYPPKGAWSALYAPEVYNAVESLIEKYLEG